MSWPPCEAVVFDLDGTVSFSVSFTRLHGLSRVSAICLEQLLDTEPIYYKAYENAAAACVSQRILVSFGVHLYCVY
jgi:hypothetical protein